MRRDLMFLFALSVLFSSCEKDEIPVAPYDRGEVVADQVDLGLGYPTQVHYSLDNEATAGSNAITDWDLTFEGGSDGWKVILNDGKMMTGWKSHFADIAAANDSSGFGAGLKIETIAAAYTNPVLGDWRTTNPVYLVDLGYNTLGQKLGLYWVQILSVDPLSYAIKTRRYNTPEITEANIPKESGVAFSRYSIRENQTIPDLQDADWNIKFTKYTYQFIDPPQPYLVAGLVLNPMNTAAAEVIDRPFEEVSLSDTSNVIFSTQPDIIGYEWKYYSFDTGTYEIDATRTWIIRTASGFYYKFRFTDFYDEQGKVGVPNFEFGKI